MRKVLFAYVMYILGMSCAHAQYSSGVPYFPQTLPAQTLIGRYSTSPGPTEAIPFSLFYSGIGAAIVAQNNTWAGVNTFSGNVVLQSGVSTAGSSSGVITLNPQAASGTYNWNWPTTAGTSGYFLTSGGGSTSPMTWTAFSGSGNVVMSTSPTITTPTLSGTVAGTYTLGGTPSLSGTLAGTYTLGGTPTLASGTLSGLTHLAGHQDVTGTAPTLTSCGTSPSIVGSDIAGQVTMGTGTPTGCTITFASAYTAAPLCNVSWLTNITSMQFTVSTTAITITQTATSSNKIVYRCTAQSGG
jgi:hypothetical protein